MVSKKRASLPVVLVDDESAVLFSSQMVLKSAGLNNVLTV